VGFEEYFEGWIKSYAGSTSRGFSETTRPEYRRPIEQHALPRWRTWKLDDVEAADVRELFADMRAGGASTSQITKLRAALSAMFENGGGRQRRASQPGARRAHPAGHRRARGAGAG
jgi:hypothetical protein